MTGRSQDLSLSGTPAGNPNPSALLPFSKLPPEEQLDRRKRLSARVMAVLSEFWLDDTTLPAVRAIQIEGWLDVLQELTEDEFRAAWANYQRSGPRAPSGKLIRPDAGALRDMAMRARAFAERAKPKPRPEPEPVLSPEEIARRREFAQAELQRLGFAKAMRPGGPVRETVTDEDKAEMAEMLRGQGND